MNKQSIIIVSIVSGLLISATSFVSGYFLSKKINSIKKFDGELYIDYTENSNNPAIYLNNLDATIFRNKPMYITIKTKHIRK